MFAFKGMIQKFSSKGEKTGWTYIDIPDDILAKLKRKDKKEFRIKGVVDDVKFERMATYPVGHGRYIIALNTELRKQLGKKEGAMVSLKIELDTSEALQSQELTDCLNEDRIAKKQFDSLLLSQRNYFHRYVYSAKGAPTKAGRIVNIINAMYKKQDFGEMIRSLKKDK
ncbi:MAG: YdeI/OmpD-associated family protein [Bacteroidota bacterium]